MYDMIRTDLFEGLRQRRWHLTTRKPLTDAVLCVDAAWRSRVSIVYLLGLCSKFAPGFAVRVASLILEHTPKKATPDERPTQCGYALLPETTRVRRCNTTAC